MLPKKKIRFSNTFAEMEDDQLKYYASLTPEELLRNHKILSLAVFGLKKERGFNKLERIIKFTKE